MFLVVVYVYVSNKWTDYVNVIREATVVTKDYEIISITIDKPKFKKLFISCVYKPPKGKIDELYKFMTDIVNRFQSKKYEIWILGDFNTDFLKRDEINIIRTFRFLKKLGLKQLIDAVTRPNKKNGSCIDWIITDSYFVKDSGILDDFVSDHYSVYCVCKKVKEHISMTVRNVRDYSAFDKNNYDVLLSNSDWSVFDRTEVPEIQWEIMLRNVRNILSIMCPYKRVNTRKDTTPWITQDINTLIREKRKLVKRYKMTRDPNTLIEMRHKRNELNSKIDKAKALYIQNALKWTVKKPRKFWKLIKGLISEDDCVDITSYMFKDISTNIDIPKNDVPDFLNEYFVNIARRTCGNFNHDEHDYTELYPCYDCNLDFAPPVAEEMYGYMESIGLVLVSHYYRNLVIEQTLVIGGQFPKRIYLQKSLKK